MATNPGSYGSSAPSAPSGTPPPAAPVAAGSFPQSPTGQGLGVNGIPVANISVADFLANYDISTTEESTYVSAGAKGQPALNQNALFLMQYKAMSPTDREDLQQSMVNAGLIPASDANGINNSAALGGFKTAIANAATSGIQVDQYLQQYSGTNNVNQALAKATAGAEAEAQAPVTATLENPTTLSATITNAFNQALGYSPDPAQVDAFVKQVQGQDTSNAEAPHEAAKAQLAALKSDQSQLEQLGPNGITAIITAYANAIHGVNPAAGNVANPQGPATGSEPDANNPNFLTPGSKLPADTTAGVGPSGGETLANVPPTIGSKTTQVSDKPGYGAQVLHNLEPQNMFGVGPLVGALSLGHVQGTTLGGGTQSETQQTSTPGQGMLVAPNLPAGIKGTTSIYGGFYAMTPADWAEAKKLTPAAAKYATAGAAPLAIQQSAFTSLLQNVYDNNGGSWTDAIITIAGGTAGKAASEKELGSSTNLQTFAANIASQVNDQLSQLTNSINTNNVTVKTTAPDAAAEANLAAKNSDPVGYAASNYSSWAGTLSKMLYGAPSTAINSTADAFTGPVTPPAPPSALAGATA